jgi:hypothetical protein
VLANSSTPVPANGAWADNSGYPDHNGTYTIENSMASPRAGRFVGGWDTLDCNNWTETQYDDLGTPTDAQGRAVTAAGVALTACKTSLPVACCSTPYKEKFVGFGTPVDGNRGGRALMNFQCASQFSGSHLCHYAEYVRASSHTTPPASGAWVDNSGFIDQNGTYTIENSLASVESGRFVGAWDTLYCKNWTETQYDDLGTLTDAQGRVVTPAGIATVACKEQHAPACCE